MMRGAVSFSAGAYPFGLVTVGVSAQTRRSSMEFSRPPRRPRFKNRSADGCDRNRDDRRLHALFHVSDVDPAGDPNNHANKM